MKVLFLVINLIINLVVFNDNTAIEKIENEIEEFVDYAPEDYLTYNVVENAVEEAIVYGITNDKITEKGVAEIDEKGVLYCYKKDSAFIIRINPKSNSFNNTAIIVRVFVV